jgi:hypothetical protein
VRERLVTRGVRLKLRAEKVDSLAGQMVPLLTNAFILLEEASKRALTIRVNANQTRLHTERGNCR